MFIFIHWVKTAHSISSALVSFRLSYANSVLYGCPADSHIVPVLETKNIFFVSSAYKLHLQGL